MFEIFSLFTLQAATKTVSGDSAKSLDIPAEGNIKGLLSSQEKKKKLLWEVMSGRVSVEI